MRTDCVGGWKKAVAGVSAALLAVAGASAQDVERPLGPREKAPTAGVKTTAAAPVRAQTTESALAAPLASAPLEAAPAIAVENAIAAVGRDPLDTAPNMIGGFHSFPISIFHEVLDDANFNFIQQGTITDIPVPGGRSLLVSENNTPLARDRYYFLYNHFSDVFTTTAFSTGSAAFRSRSWDVDRYTLGFEKRLPDGNWSLEVRVPFSSTLDPGLTLDVSDNLGNRELAWGNISVILKEVVYQSSKLALSVGLGVETPTAPNSKVRLTEFAQVFNGTTGVTTENLIRFKDLRVDNDAVHLTPFLAMIYAPNESWFLQSFLQVNCPTDSNDVTYTDQLVDLQQLDPNTTSNFGPTTTRRAFGEQTLLQWSLAMGYWMVRNPNGWITGVAPSLELDYTATLDNAHPAVITPDPLSLLRRNANGASSGQTQDLSVVNNFQNQMTILTMTLGLTFEVSNNSTLALGFGFPLTSNADRSFDYQVQLQLNHRFGAQCHCADGCTGGIRP